MNKCEFMLVTGTGRCGTQALGKALELEGEFGLHDRPDLGKELLLSDQMHRAAIQKRIHLTQNPFDKRWFRKRWVEEIYSPNNIKNITGDASNLGVYVIDEVVKQIRGSKIILMVRNGRDFVCSAVSRKWDTYDRFSHAPSRNDDASSEWETMCPISRCAWIWSYRNFHALKGLQNVPVSRKMIIKLEDLTVDNLLLKEQIEDFMGYKIPSPEFLYSNYNTNNYKVIQPKYRERYVYPHEWSDKENVVFDKYAGKMMKEFGYD